VAKLYDMAQMTVTTAPGIGAINLNAAAVSADGTTYLTFAQAGALDGDIVSYEIKDGPSWEIGRGTYAAAGLTLSRTVLKSTNSNAAINAGTGSLVSIVALAEDFTDIASGGAFLPLAGGTISGTPGSLAIGAPIGGPLEAGSLNSSRRVVVNRDAVNPLGTGQIGVGVFEAQGNTGEAPAIRLTGYAGLPYIEARRAQGNSTTPSPNTANQNLLQIRAHGWAVSDWSGGVAGYSGALAFVTVEAQSATNQGTRIDFFTTPAATAAAGVAMVLSKGLIVGAGTGVTADMGAGTVNALGAGYYINNVPISPTQPHVAWIAGQNPNNLVLYRADATRTIVSCTGVLSVAESGAATVTINRVPAGISTRTPIHSGSFNCQGTVLTADQGLTLTTTTLLVGDRLVVSTTGTFTLGVGSISVIVQ
jgi:hypothetical protein